jgi:ubiquinone/menaquinone biosynthesis C-methylase UbiE
MSLHLSGDEAFAGSIAAQYERYLVPLIFEPYATDLAARVTSRSPQRVLEIAAGTGVVTRAMSATLARDVAIVATDLSQSMIDHARTLGTARPVEWRQADVMALPFDDQEFDAVVCQFGVMFFPDKSTAFAEAHRVLRPGGVFIFNVWERIEENEFADSVATAVASMFPSDPPTFLARTPYGYFERSAIHRDLSVGEFRAQAQVTTIAERSRADSATIPAVAFCLGTPLKNEIEARDPTRVAEAVDVSTQALVARFGDVDLDARMRACIVEIRR